MARLVAEDLRVDVDGAPACDGLSLETKAERVLVLGAPRALFEAATGLVPAVRGRVVASGTIAGAAMDPPTPPRFDVREYVIWSARLAGLSSADARANADDAIARLKLDAMAKTKLDRLVPHARRAAVVAAAIATGAEIVALEDPLGGLPDDASASFAAILAEALDGRPWLVFAPRVHVASPLALAAGEAIVVAGDRVVAQGAPVDVAAEGRRFVMRLTGPAASVAESLSARGVTMEERGWHVLVDLGAEATTAELLRTCDAAGLAVLELVPVARALS